MPLSTKIGKKHYENGNKLHGSDVNQAVDSMTIGKNIDKICREIGLSRVELADQSGVPERTVRSIVGDEVDPKVSTIKKIIIALGVSADQVLFDDEESLEGTDIKILFRDINKLEGDDREYAKKVIKGVLIHMRSQELLSK